MTKDKIEIFCKVNKVLPPPCLGCTQNDDLCPDVACTAFFHWRIYHAKEKALWWDAMKVQKWLKKLLTGRK